MESLNFTGLDVEPYEVLLFSYAGAVISFFVALILDILIMAFHHFSFGEMGYVTLIMMVGITVGLPVAALQFISEYPKSKARYMKIHSLGNRGLRLFAICLQITHQKVKVPARKPASPLEHLAHGPFTYSRYHFIHFFSTSL